MTLLLRTRSGRVAERAGDSLFDRLWTRLLVAHLAACLRADSCSHDGSSGVCHRCVHAAAAGFSFPTQEVAP